MPVTLATVVNSISEIPNHTNAFLISEFYDFMKSNGTSESYQKNNLKAIINYAQWLYKTSPSTTFYDIGKKEQVLKFLDTKIKSQKEDPEQRWITTWNDYMSRLKFFYRWLYNIKVKERTVDEIPMHDWETPSFVLIRKKKSKRLSPYSANEIWELEELQTIVKYEPQPRNKAAIMLLWDLDARPHEVTNIEIRNVRFKERYAEGEIPSGKTGSGPILLTASYPYVRDWYNQHPFKHQNSRLICDLRTGKPITSDYIWTMMMELRQRIETMLKEGAIKDDEERKKLELLLRTKRWNPYCIRHSAITHDSDYLPGFALNKKVRWSMNSKQPARYLRLVLSIPQNIIGYFGN